MTGIDWSAAEDALKAAVEASLTALVVGLQVHWLDSLANPHSVPPPNAILDLQLSPEDRSDEREDYDSSAPRGQEIVLTTSQSWEAILEITVHAAREGTTGAYSARALAAQLLTDLQRPSVIAGLLAVGLGFTDISGVVAKKFEPVDGWKPGTVAAVRFFASTEAIDREGYATQVRLVPPAPDQPFLGGQ